MKIKKDIWLKADHLANEFLAFNKDAISPFHVAHNVEKLLKEKNFIKLEENLAWDLQKGQNYYLIKGGSSVVAFTVPHIFSADKSGFKLISTHTDSPCLRLAPNFEVSSSNFSQCYVQCYGGGLWNTWMDRELLLGGKVAVKTEEGIENRLFLSKTPIGKISNLAIHLKKEREKVEINKEVHLRPIIASSIFEPNEGKCSLREYISNEMGINLKDILGFDLCFADAHHPGRFGLHSEFISSARLDNLYSVFCSGKALLEAIDELSEEDKLTDVNILFMYDHEEIGSETSIGARSNLTFSLLQRICTALQLFRTDDFSRILSRSFMLSCDMGHSYHPNYTTEHQVAHTPRMNEGVVLKINCNGRYTSETSSIAAIRFLAEKAEIPLNNFIVHNESSCGSTVGPPIAAALGCYSVDIGAPMLGMHSVRETAGVLDFYYYTELMKQFIKSPLVSFTPKDV